ncbi:MAG: AMP-binding protein [Myxococcales bacterium]|nr:AMP-binding protein [Myxococcales bacterium]
MHGAKGASRRSAKDALAGAYRWAKLLSACGTSKGDRVLVLLPTGHAFAEALFGAMLLGAIPVPLASPMTFGSVDRYLENLGRIAKSCGARTIVTYPRIRDAVSASPLFGASVGRVLVEADLDGLAATPLRLPSIAGADTAFLQYTSGTTGRPKGVVISHRAIVANASAIADGLQLGADDVGVSWLPMFHDMGLIGVLLTSICHPYPVHAMPPESFVMQPRRWLELVARERATMSAAPNFAYDLCVTRARDTAELRLDTWRLALNGAEAVHASTLARFAARFAENGLSADVSLPVYGLAEATLAVTFPPMCHKTAIFGADRDVLERDGRAVLRGDGHPIVGVGRPVAGTSIQITAPSGAVLREGEVGEIRVRSASSMDGYFGDDAASAEVLVDGQLRTGDLGFLDQGTLYVTGRAKDLIIKGGRNLCPWDVERVAGEIDGVRQGGVAAFGRANARTGTEDLVVVAETLHADTTRRELLAKAIQAELLEVLGVKPDEVRLCGVGKVPRTTSGKIRRRECARLLAVSELG